VDIAPKLASAVPHTERNFMDFMPKIDPDEIRPLQFKPVFFDEVELILSTMIGKVSFSQDDISNKKLKHIAKVISFPLSHLINLSIRRTMFPQPGKLLKLFLYLKVVTVLSPQIIGP
jgi:hypothetical protein